MGRNDDNTEDTSKLKIKVPPTETPKGSIHFLGRNGTLVLIVLIVCATVTIVNCCKSGTTLFNFANNFNTYGTKEPLKTEEPTKAENSADMGTPTDAEKPADTGTPTDAEKPADTGTPTDAEKPAEGSEPSEGLTGTKYRVAVNSCLHLREGPSRDTRSLMNLPNECIVVSEGSTDEYGWMPVRVDQSNLTGYVCATYLVPIS